MSKTSKLLKMSKVDTKVILKTKFRGCLVGSLLGDCLGSPYEGDIISSGDKIIIQRYFDKLETPTLKGPMRCYTDDTAMTKSIVKSLIRKPEIDYQDMAKLFVQEYFMEPHRGYGQNVVDVFNKLRKTKYEDIYKPATQQFSGSGSFGNGGAMRIAPIALYFYNGYECMLDAATKSTKITHSNPLGVHGALLQCIAVHQALNHDPKKPIDPQVFTTQLLAKMKHVEAENEHNSDLNGCTPYQNKLTDIKNLLKTKYNDELDDEVIAVLGNSISAYESVPTAIYCFLRALNEIPTIQTSNVFRRTIQYAITLGGDTDTIASMAGAIAGAYLGDESINQNLLRQCEMHQETMEMANTLHDMVVK